MSIEDESSREAIVSLVEILPGKNETILGFEVKADSQETANLVMQDVIDKTGGTPLVEDPRTKDAPPIISGPKLHGTGFGSRGPKAATYIPLRDRSRKTDD